MQRKELESEWTWARGLTVDLLKAASASDLNFSPCASSGPLWKQFRHIGRVHENYLTAFKTKRIEFGMAGCHYDGGASKEALIHYLIRIEEQHQATLKTIDSEITIDWFGQPVSPTLHLTRLLSHETLHHGQLMLYWKSLGKPFPKSWTAWGE